VSFLRSFFHKHIKKTPIYTVQLRGRLSDSDNVFLKTNAKKYILSAGGVEKKVRSSTQPIFFEVGFGNGSHIVGLAKSYKDTLVIGSEMYMAGVVNTLRSSKREGLDNLFVTSFDAREVLKKLPDNSLDRVYTLFPDPWPKVRHNKRRLVKREFVELTLSKLKQGGLCVIATDWAEYASEIQEVVKKLLEENTVQKTALTEEENRHINETTFAVRAKEEGRGVSLFVLEKIK
jgi:tRNA (guanine-N7-)-methyltransferase